MNHVYSLVWNRALRAMQVASELATSHGGGSSKTSSLLRRPLALPWSVAVLVLGGSLVVSPAQAASYTVTAATDGGDISVTNTLSWAIQQANNDPGSTIIIDLPAGATTIAESGTLPTMTTSTTFVNAANVTIDGTVEIGNGTGASTLSGNAGTVGSTGANAGLYNIGIPGGSGGDGSNGADALAGDTHTVVIVAAGSRLAGGGGGAGGSGGYGGPGVPSATSSIDGGQGAAGGNAGTGGSGGFGVDGTGFSLFVAGSITGGTGGAGGLGGTGGVGGWNAGGEVGKPGYTKLVPIIGPSKLVPIIGPSLFPAVIGGMASASGASGTGGDSGQGGDGQAAVGGDAFSLLNFGNITGGAGGAGGSGHRGTPGLSAFYPGGQGGNGYVYAPFPNHHFSYYPYGQPGAAGGGGVRVVAVATGQTARWAARAVLPSQARTSWRSITVYWLVALVERAAAAATVATAAAADPEVSAALAHQVLLLATVRAHQASSVWAERVAMVAAAVAAEMAAPAAPPSPAWATSNSATLSSWQVAVAEPGVPAEQPVTMAQTAIILLTY